MNKDTASNSAFDLMDRICEALILFKAPIEINGDGYFIKTTINLDEKSYQKFETDFKKVTAEINIDNICYGGFQFSIKKIQC